MKKSAILCLTVLALTGCATGDKLWTDAQKSSLNQITVPAINFTNDAYRSPSAISSGAATQQLSGIVNFNGLPIGLLAGALIDGAVAGVQQSKYNALYATQYPMLEDSIKKNSADADALVVEALKKNPYIAERLNTNSNNKLNITINKHGLTRYGKTSVDNMDLVYYIDSNSILTNAAGDILMTQNNLPFYSGVKKMDDILKDPQILTNMQKSAYQSLGTNLMFKISYLAGAVGTTPKVVTLVPITTAVK